jgi:formylglycine-generating enzyme required for sulfatase activity
VDGPLELDGPKPDQTPGDSGVVPGTWKTIAKGTFTMGSPPDEPCRDSMEQQHQVTLTHDFELQTTEVSGGQFLGLMGYNPSQMSCGLTCPVEMVSWHEAAAYCNALSQTAGKAVCYTCSGSLASVTCQEAAAYSGPSVYKCPGYRLPTEAEWEYAYRAGTTTAYYNGASDGAKCTTCSAKDANLDKIGWYCANSNNSSTYPTAQKQPNPWGLYDLAGNVHEWCHDWHNQSDLSGPSTDPWGSVSGTARVMRGGAWDYPAHDKRAAFRERREVPKYRDLTLGFRCARTKDGL